MNRRSATPLPLLIVIVFAALGGCSAPTGGGPAGTGGGASDSGGGSAAGSGGGGGGEGTGGVGGGTVVDGGAAAIPLSFDLDAATAALNDYLNTLLATPAAERRPLILAYLAARPEVLASGTNDDGVWALYETGIPVMILDNREPDPDVTIEKPMPDGLLRSDVPKGTRARLVNTMGTAYVDETKAMRTLLASRGYNVVSDPGTVDSLRRITGDGVLYVSAHGGLCEVPVFNDKGELVLTDGKPNMVPQFGLWTRTPVSVAGVNAYLKDLQSGRLGLGFALHDYTPDKTQVTYERHFWVTDLWAYESWSFAKNALAWISACQSQSAVAQGFRDACLDDTPTATKASLYVGWTGKVNGAAALLGGKFVIDRMLGANLAAPKESPPQRPFDYPAVWADLRKRGLHLHPAPNGGTTELTYSEKPGGKLGMLAPSLQYVLIDETLDEAILVGLFGEPEASERSVLIGGLEATVKEWTDTRVRVALPRTGAGSSGDVVVWVRAHESNTRRITEWSVPFHYTWADGERAPCKVDGPMTLRFRADVGDYREKPGEAPKKPVRYAIGAGDSQATLTASGSHVESDCTTTWSGVGTLAAAGFGHEDTSPVVLAYARFDAETHQLALATQLGFKTLPIDPWEMTIVCKNQSTLTQPFAPAFGFLEGKFVEFHPPADDTQPGPTLPTFNWTLDESWNTTAGTFVDSTFTPNTITFTWSAASAASAPDPDAAR